MMTGTNLKILDSRALVVDDNEVNRMFAQMLLEEFGMRTECAENGSVAVLLAAEQSYDFILMDYMMPEMDGYETVKRIRTGNGKSAQTLIAVYSADITDEMVTMFQAYEVNDMLLKPLDPNAISRLLRAHFPKNQIVFCEREEGSNDMASLFASVSGLDYRMGLRYALGKEAQYLKILRASCGNLTRCYQALVDCYKEIEADQLDGAIYEQIHLQAHSLKGICSSIGFAVLSQRAAELEHSAVYREAHFLVDKLRLFLELIAIAKSELEQAVTAYDELSAEEDGNGQYEPLQEEQYQALLLQARQHAERFEFVEMQHCLDELMIATQPENRALLAEVHNYANEFNYDGICTVLDTLLQTV